MTILKLPRWDETIKPFDCENIIAAFHKVDPNLDILFNNDEKIFDLVYLAREFWDSEKPQSEYRHLMRFEVPGQPRDVHKFRQPCLRDVEWVILQDNLKREKELQREIREERARKRESERRHQRNEDHAWAADEAHDGLVITGHATRYVPGENLTING